MRRAPDPWHFWLVAISATLEWLLGYRARSRRVKAHLAFGQPRPINRR